MSDELEKEIAQEEKAHGMTDRTVKIPEEYFYANLSLWALGLICHITAQESDIEQIAKERGVTFDQAVKALYVKEYGMHIFRSAMSELVAAGIYEYDDK